MFTGGIFGTFVGRGIIPKRGGLSEPYHTSLRGSRVPPNKQVGFPNLIVNPMRLRFGSQTHPGSDQFGYKESVKMTITGKSRSNIGSR